MHARATRCAGRELVLTSALMLSEKRESGSTRTALRAAEIPGTEISGTEIPGAKLPDTLPPSGPRDEARVRPKDDAVVRAVDAAMALVFILLGLPLFAGIALLVLIVDGRPVLHKGTRLGRHRRPYTMYKFRTLVRDASSKIGHDLVSFKHRATIPCGRFLRDTRLDELPQLFNILLGDMRFIGPRPERPEVYDRLCRDLDGYDQRFSVKPGLIGYSQLFTPHGAPKRLRHLTDRLTLRRTVQPFWSTMEVLRTIAVVARSVLGRLLRAAWDGLLGTRILRLHRNRRETPRVRARNAELLIDGVDGGGLRVPIDDINETALLVCTQEKAVGDGALLNLRIRVRFRRRLWAASRRVRVARLNGRIIQTRAADGAWQQVVRYESATEWDQYIIEQYVLRASLASPFW